MNLFLHYVFDAWMKAKHPSIPFCRYADDGLVHCNSKKQAEFLMDSLRKRFDDCGLELHPEKTKIFYCKDTMRKSEYPEVSFDFLGYKFRPRFAKDKYGRHFISFLPGVSGAAMKAMRQTIRCWKLQLQSDKSLDDLSRMWRRVLQGWSNYYAKFYKSAIRRIWMHFDLYLVRWAMHKYKRFRGHKKRAVQWLGEISRSKPYLFPHWKDGFIPWLR